MLAKSILKRGLTVSDSKRPSPKNRTFESNPKKTNVSACLGVYWKQSIRDGDDKCSKMPSFSMMRYDFFATPPNQLFELYNIYNSYRQ